jgi:hypothetical protein
MGVIRNELFFSESWPKKLLRRPKRRWEDNIKMDLKGIVKEGANWAVLNAVMNLRFKTHRISWVGDRLLAIEGLRSVEMIGFCCLDRGEQML